MKGQDPLDPDSFGASLGGGTGGAASPDAATALDTEAFIGVDKNYRYVPPIPAGQKPTGTPGSPASWRQAEGSGFGQTVGIPQYKNGSEDRLLSTLSVEDLWGVQRAMASAGLITAKQRLKPGDPGDPVTIAAFRKVLGYANHFGSDWKVALTELVRNPPVAAEDLGLGSPGGSNGGKGGKEPGFTGKKTHTNRSVSLTDPKTAQELADRVLEQHLGRKATPAEYRSFVASLHGAEKASPSVTTSTESYANGDYTGSTSTTTGGLDEAGMAQVGEDFINKNPALKAESDKFLTETDYFNAAMAALGSPQ